MLDFLRRKPKTEIEIVRRDPLRVTIKEWRSSPERVALAKRALADPVMLQLMDILHLNHMGMWSMDSAIPLDVRAIRAAQCEGYIMALNDLQSLAQVETPAKPLEATFAPENYEQVEVTQESE